jgi:transposase
MLGPKLEAQGALFYEFSIDDHVPQDHLLRSIDPELLIRMLLVGYCLGIRSERRLCEEVQHIAGSWTDFCGPKSLSA